MKAQAPRCDGAIGKSCSALAVIANIYSWMGEPRDTNAWCAECASECHAEFDALPGYDFDRYEPIILATLGDELCIALDHALQTLCGERDGKIDNEADNAAARARRLGRSAA